MKDIRSFMGKTPKVEEDIYIDMTAVIIGDVILKRGCSIWPQAVIRADTNSVFIEEGAAILDRVIIEAPVSNPVFVGRRAIISHGAILHGCKVCDGAIIGIGAIVLDGAVIAEGTVVAAGSIIPPRADIPRYSLVIGTPGKVIRPLTAEEREKYSAQVSEIAEKAKYYKTLFG